MNPADLPNLVGATVIECSIEWEKDAAELLMGPLNTMAQSQAKAPHLRLRLHGLRQMDLPHGLARDARVRAMHGPARTESGTWILDLELGDDHSFSAEFVSLEFAGTYPGQVHESGDLYSQFQEVLRTTIGALVVGDLRSVRLLPTSGAHEDILYEVHVYPTTLAHPPRDAYEEMFVLPLGDRDEWHLILPLWSPEGRTDLSILMEVHRINNELVGFLESVHVL